MSGKHYTEEFGIEVVKQVKDREYKVDKEAKRLGVTTKSLYGRIKKYGDVGSQHQTITSHQEDLCRTRRSAII